MNLTTVSVWWNTLFVAVLQRSLGALWLIPAVLVLRLVLKRAPKWISCLLWALVAVELVCPVQISSPLSVRNMAPKSPPVEIRYTEEIEKPELFVDFPAIPGYPDNQSTRATKQNIHTSDFYIPPLRNLWLAGAALMLTYGALSALRLRRRVAAALPTEDDVWICDSIDTPFVLGIVRPRIYLPSALEEQERDSVLAHERAHLQRRDHWWKLLGFLILAVYWFHPLVWLSYLLLGRDIELACDERVCRGMSMAQRKLYAQTLLSLSVSRSTMMASPLGFGEVGVKERVKNVAKYKKPTVLVTVAAVVLVLFAAVAFGTEGQGSKKLTLSFQELTISEVGDEVQLTADGGNGVYTWESDDPAVAQVDDNGVVTSEAAGDTTVHCTSGDGQSAECKVTVQDGSPEGSDAQADESDDLADLRRIPSSDGRGTEASRLAAEFAPYGVSYDEEKGHVMYDGKIVSYITYDIHPFFTPNVDVGEEPEFHDEDGTVFLQFTVEGEDNGVLTFSRLEVFDTKTGKLLEDKELDVPSDFQGDAFGKNPEAAYGVSYDEENGHVMYNGQIVSYIERIVDATDPLTPPEHPDDEENADPEGTVILRFFMDEVENGSVTYSRLQIFDSKSRELLEDKVLNAPSDSAD